MCTRSLLLWQETISTTKESLAQVFSCEFGETSINNFFTEHLWMTASEITIIITIRACTKRQVKMLKQL